MKKKRLSFIAVLSVVSMTVTSVFPAFAAPAAGGAGRAADPLENQVLDLEFEGEVEDGTNTISGISIQGDGYEYVDGVNGGQALSLKGSAYVNLGKDVRLQPENLTLSFWINPNETITGEQIISWNKDEWWTDGWYLSSLNDNTPLTLSIGPANQGGQPYNVKVSGNRAEFFPAGEWTHIVVTYDSAMKDVQMYRNGIAQETQVAYEINAEGGATGALGSDADMEKSIGYNGPVHKGAYLNAALDHYELFNDTATAEQALALYEENKKVETAGLKNQVLDLEFEDNLADGTGINTDIKFAGSGYQYVDGANGGKALKLTGNTYIDLGKNTELQPQNLTLSFWINPEKTMTGEGIISWNKNQYYTDGWYLSSENDNVPLALSIGEGKNAGQPYKVSVKANRADFFPAGEWTHIVVTYDSATKEVVFYRNGIAQTSVIDYAVNNDRDGVLGSDESMQKSIGYNGPAYNGAYLLAALDHYELFNDTATAEEAMALYEEHGGVIDKEQIARDDLEVLNIPSETSYNLSLPTTGAQGSVITWEVTAGTAMDKNGVITRPEIGEPDAKVTLKATAVFMDGEPVTKEFEVTVLAKKPLDLSDTSLMDDVTLYDDYMVNAFTKEKEYLLSLNAEKFLYEFYNVAGLEPTTEEGYGGWERTGASNFRGHTFGHYMSALSQAYLSEDDPDVKAQLMEQIEDAVNGLKKCQDAYAELYPQSAGYISAFPEGVLARVDGGTSPTPDDGTVLVPYYNLHKVVAGLIDVAKNVDDTEVKNTAIEVAEAFGEYLYNRCTNLPNKQQLLWIEYGGMNEALYELYRITGNDHIKAAAECFDEVSLFEQLAAGQDVLSGKHANTTIPKFTGAVKRYSVLTENEEYYDKLTPEEKDNLEMYLTAAENFWDIVVNDHTYITGGNSQSEHFHNAGELCYDATKGSYDGALTCETCNTYNMLKLTKALYDQTQDPKYLDYFERTFTNAILASQNPETGTTMYFQPMAAGYNKVYNRPFDEFWCCTGTGMENFSKLGDYIYQIKGNTLYVNMFYSSAIEDEGLGISFTQDANIPNEDTVIYTVNDIADGTSVALRRPEWLAGDAVIKVNGKEQDVAEENGFFVLDGLKAGDEISYTMPMQVEFESTADNENFVAFKYGPVVLAAELGSKDIDASQANGILVRVGTEDTSAKDTITIQNMTVKEWKENITENFVRIEDSEDGRIQFQLKNTDSDELIYSPYYMQHEQRYGIYMNLEEPDSQASQDRILAEKEELREQEVSVDYLDSFDNNNSEFAKNLQVGGDTSTGSFNGRTFRHANAGGWWSYDFNVDPEAEHNYLGCTWYSGDQGRSFDIYVNDQLLQTVTINNSAGTNVFYEDLYDITDYIEDGESKVTVKFQSTGGYAGGLFGIRVITSTEYDTDARLSGLTFDQGTLEPAFDPDVNEYTLTVGKDVEAVNMLASTMKKSGLVYIGDILFDNSNERLIRLDGDETAVTLTSYAQDHKASLNYTITIVKSEEEEPEPTLEKIEITGPAKTEYTQGEKLDLSGLVVTAVYSNDSKVELQAGDYTVSGYDPNAAGKQTVTVTYDGKTATFTVTVTKSEEPEPALEKIEITGPAKTEYTQGEKLDLSGLVVTAVYSDSSRVELQAGDYTVSGYDPDTAGKQTVTVTYGGKTAEFTVTVEEKQTTDPSDPTDPADPSDPTDPSDPSGPAQPSDPQGGAGQQTGGSSQGTDGADSSKAVQTGDTTNVFGAAAACVLALGMAGTVVYVRRKRS